MQTDYFQLNKDRITNLIIRRSNEIATFRADIFLNTVAGTSNPICYQNLKVVYWKYLIEYVFYGLLEFNP